MPALTGRQKEQKRKLAVLRRPFANRVTKEMVDAHALHLQTRIDRRKAEQANNYQTEYNIIAGRANRAGASAHNLAAIAMRNFVATHGARHLPK